MSVEVSLFMRFILNYIIILFRHFGNTACCVLRVQNLVSLELLITFNISTSQVNFYVSIYYFLHKEHCCIATLLLHKQPAHILSWICLHIFKLNIFSLHISTHKIDSFTVSTPITCICVCDLLCICHWVL